MWSGAIVSSFVLSFVSSLAQSPATAPAIPTTAPRAIFERPDGVEVRALAGLDVTDPRTLGARRVRFEGVGASAPTSGDRIAIELATGDRIVGVLRSAAAEDLVVEIAPRASVRTSLEDLRSLRFDDRIPPAWTSPLERAADGDRLYRTRGESLERIDGGVEEFSADGLKFHGALVGSLEVPWKDVVALFVEPLGSTPPVRPPDAAWVVVDAAGGARVSGRLVRIGERGVRIARGAEEIELAPADVRELYVDDGRLVFLSSIAPSESPPSRPFGDAIGASFAPRADRNVFGDPLSAGGRTWTRGFGVHAPSRLAWTLPAGFTKLSGAAAIDDSVLRLSARGSARFRVLGDGRELWASAVLRGGDAPSRFSVAIAGVRELALEVDVADESYVADRANWLDLVLERAADDQRSSERK